MRWGIWVSKSIGLAQKLEENLPFLLSFTLYYFVFEDNFLSTSPGGLYSEERFNGGFISLRAVGDLQLEGLIHGGAYFRNFTVFWNAMKEGLKFLILCVFNTDLFFFLRLRHFQAPLD